jgi:RIO kinase 1
MFERKTYAHVFDQYTVTTLNKLESDGYIGQLFGALGSGKESYVFYSVDAQEREVAVKIHRHSIYSFKKIPEYLKLRGKSSGGFLKRIDDWMKYEFTLQTKAFSIGLKVSEPYRVYNNVMVMKFIGKDGLAAPLAVFSKGFAVDKWYNAIISDIIQMGKVGIIHGDLSAYNILDFNGEPYLIDFSQALKLSSSTKSFLLRDVNNINQWFLRLKYRDILSAEEVEARIGKSL